MERELVKAALADEALIALTGYDRAARVSVLDKAEALLTQQNCRIVRLQSPDGRPLNLRSAMDQVVTAGTDGGDRVERFFDMTALPAGRERRIVLMVDDAQLLTNDLLSYLALIGSTTVGQDVRPQIVLAGDASMWGNLPRVGNLVADRFTSRIDVGLAAPVIQPVPPIEPAQQSPPVPDFASPASKVTADHQPPTYGHEGLRQRLAHRHRRRERIGLFTSRLVARVLTTAFVCTVIVATVILWARLPELRVAVRQWAASEARVAQTDDSTVAALVARGNWLLAKGDIPAARAVFENAALTGSAPAVTGLAKANDPRYLTDIGVHGVTSDASRAIGLYKQAAAMGDREAADRLSRLQAALKH